MFKLALKISRGGRLANGNAIYNLRCKLLFMGGL